MTEADEKALLERCQRGDRSAFLDLFRKYEKPVYNVALRITGNRDDAADVVQTVFVKAFENLQRFDPQYRFFSWIYRIAVNESIRSSDFGKRWRPLTATGESVEPGPESNADAERVSQAVQSSLLELDAKYRAVVVLKHFLDFSYREISTVLDISEQVVKSRLYTARQSLKESLQARNVT